MQERSDLLGQLRSGMPRNILDTPPSLTERLAAGFFLGDILVSVDNSWLEPEGGLALAAAE